MSNKTRNYFIKQVETENEWRDYLDLMWHKLRENLELSQYEKIDFLESGNINLILCSEGRLVGGLYAKETPQKNGSIVIHRFFSTNLEELKQLFLYLENQQVEYRNISLLVSQPSEIDLIEELGYQILGHHPNSTAEEQLIWARKKLSCN